MDLLSDALAQGITCLLYTSLGHRKELNAGNLDENDILNRNWF